MAALKNDKTIAYEYEILQAIRNGLDSAVRAEFQNRPPNRELIAALQKEQGKYQAKIGRFLNRGPLVLTANGVQAL